MPLKRFWGSGAAVGQWAALSAASLKHARVARLRDGEAVELIDGAGNFWRGVFDKDKDGVRVQETGHQKKAHPEIVLAAGVTQGGSFDEIVRQATELGAAAIVPLHTRNSAPILDAKREKAKVERWERHVEEACKQCGLYWKPQIIANPILDIAGVLALDRFSGAHHVVAALGLGESESKNWSSLRTARTTMVPPVVVTATNHAQAQAQAQATASVMEKKFSQTGLSNNTTTTTTNDNTDNNNNNNSSSSGSSSNITTPAPTPRTIIAWVGPEGGFTQREYELLRAKGASFVSLGQTILRADTACVAMLSRLQLINLDEFDF